MSTPEFQRLNALFDELADLPPEQRRGHLDAASDISDSTRARVARLLDAHNRVGEATLRRIVDTEIFEPTQWLGRRIGTYRVERELGHGGMGSVFLARRADSDVDQVVAIKIVRPERLDENTLARFRLERQVLALLRHPNIATMIDLGELDDGSPYVVMEYVEGVPITAYAKDLDVKHRLALFLIVCDAVAYAHRSMIVHRDIKPSNILVEPNGRPRLLDFGIAKPLSAKMGDLDVERTGTQQQFFSIYSASPEQLRGDVITVTCDVYGLGMLLHELLTGKPAFDFTGLSPAQIEQRVLETDPPPPSSVVPVGRDLDAITLRALRKAPEQRYASVEELRADVERYLSKRPVLARRGEWLYRAGRFVARHRLSLTAAAVVAGALVFNGVLLWRQYLISDATTTYFLSSIVSERPARSAGDMEPMYGGLWEMIGDSAVSRLPAHRVGLAGLAESDDEAQLRHASAEMAAALFETTRNPLRAVTTPDLKRRFYLIDAQERVAQGGFAPAMIDFVDMQFAMPVDQIAKAVIEAAMPRQHAQDDAMLAQLRMLHQRYRNDESILLQARLALAKAFAVLLLARGEATEAVAVRREIVARQRASLGKDAPRIVQSLLDLAQAERSAGDFAAERSAAVEASAMIERFGYLSSTDAQTKVQTALGIALMDSGQTDEGIALMEAAISAQARRSRFTLQLAFLHANLGALLYDLPDRREPAERHLLEAARLAPGRRQMNSAAIPRDEYYLVAMAAAFQAKVGNYAAAAELLGPLQRVDNPQFYRQDIQDFVRAVHWLSLSRSCPPAVDARQAAAASADFERGNPRTALRVALEQIKGEAAAQPAVRCNVAP